jgi:hypothetical protein
MISAGFFASALKKVSKFTNSIVTNASFFEMNEIFSNNLSIDDK